MTPLLEECFEKVSHLGPLASVKKRFWNEFKLMGMPQKKMPGYQYIPSTTFSEKNLDKKGSSSTPLLTSFSGPTLVFIEGVFSKEASSLEGIDPSIVIEPLSYAYKTFGSFLSQSFNNNLKQDKDPLSLLSFALHQEAVFIYLPVGKQLNCPLRVVQIGSSPILAPRIHLFASKNSSIDLYLYSEEGNDCTTLESLDLVLDESAHVNIYSKKKEALSTHFSFVRATLKKSAKLSSISLLGSHELQRADYKIQLVGENASADLFGLSLLEGYKSAHVNVHMEHKSPNTTSKQHFKGVLKDAAKASFEGKIYVHKEAMKTDAFQLNNYLLLSPHVIANSKPNLEIFADDVKASHGATVGRLNQEALFYLKSRGIPKEEASAMLVEGFTEEITQLMPKY